MNEIEAREIAKISKWGEPRGQWSQERPNTLTNTFGVVNADGQTHKGLHAEFEVFISPRLGQTRFVFSLKRFDLGSVERAYQLDINHRIGIKKNDHHYSHEHYGEPRHAADESWATLNFKNAVERFCKNTNLTLTEEMPDYQGFDLT
jgi:hypothetical protein